MRPQIGLGDALRMLNALPELGRLRTDPRNRRDRALAMLGLHVGTRAKAQASAEPSVVDEQPTPVPSTEDDSASGPASTGGWNDALVTRSATVMPYSLTLLEGVEPLAAELEDPHESEPPIQPLFNPAWQRGILVASLRADIVSTEIDLDLTVERVARLEPIERLPRLVRPSLQGGVQIVVDCGDSMAPFVDDQAQIIAAIERLVPVERLDIAVVQSWPPDPREQDEAASYRRPAPGATVLILSNFGLATPRDFVLRRYVQAWTTFASSLRVLGHPVLAFTPLDTRRLPSNLRRALTAIPWERRTGAGHVTRSRSASRTPR